MAGSVGMNSGGMGNRSFVFLAMNDFAKDGGGTLRMYGILNALAGEGCDVTLISNARHTGRFHPAIRHIAIGRPVSRRQKALLQGMTAWLPDAIVSFIYRRLLGRLKDSLAECPHETDILYSFEYLDNSLACLMKSRGDIPHYVNDTHGMAGLEFEAQFKAATTAFRKFKFRLKSLSAERLDRKHFGRALGVIYGSPEMRLYYEKNIIRQGDKPDSIIVPFVFGGDPGNRPDPHLEMRLRADHNISCDDFLFLFAGSYKATSGVDDLIEAFGKVHASAPRTKLMLIGRMGPLWESCVEKVRRSAFGAAVIFIDCIPYDELVTYQKLASVIVCPDRANSFSEYIVHTKYYDSLWSGKPVISGGLAAVRQINPEDMLSLSFDPGNVEDLCRAMEYSLARYGELSAKYGHNRKYVSDHFTYRSFAGSLIEWNNKLKNI